MDDVLPLASSFPEVRMCHPETEVNWASATLWNNKGEEQDKDPDLRILRKWMKEETNPTLEELAAQSRIVKTLWTIYWKDDILWYKWKNEENRELYLVPIQLRKTFLRLAHDNSVAGHMDT